MSVFLFILVAVLISVTVLILQKLYGFHGHRDLKNKHVLVTGGSSGIGKAVAVEAAKSGANVTIVARNKSKLEETVSEIKKVVKYSDEQKIQCISLDVTSGQNSVKQVIDSVEESVGPIFLLVNCAGMAVCGDIEQASETDYKYMMDLNYFGTVYPTIAVAKNMKKRNEGHIVITGSQASLLGIYGMSAYCASKFALRGFAESLHMELKPHNVSITLCLPPDTNTPGFENEEKSKPEITRLISETAGLFEPEIVAKQLMSDALGKNFFSVVGFEGFIMTTLCTGMSPLSGFVNTFLQVTLMSLLRLISVGYLLHFDRIIFNHFKKPSQKEKLK